MRPWSPFPALGLLLFLLPFPSAAHPAEPLFQLRAVEGTVVDASRAPVAGAVVAATSPAGRPAGSTRTDARGQFRLELPPGDYVVTATAPGFVPASHRLRAADREWPAAEVVLQVAGITETVTVDAAAGYQVPGVTTATRTFTPLRDVPQSITVVTNALVQDQLMTSMADAVRYVPGITAHQGENNRDQVIIRGNSSSADFFLNGVRDDVQYFRDFYNLERLEALKGPNALMFGRGGGGGVINRVTKEAGFQPVRDLTLQAGGFAHRRASGDFDQTLADDVAFRVNGLFEDSGSFRNGVTLERSAINPTLTYAPGARTRVVAGYEHLRDTRVADRGIPSLDGRPAAVHPSTFFGRAEDSHVRARVHVGSASVEHQAGPVTIRNRTLVGGYDRFYQNFVPGAVTPDGAAVTLTAYSNSSDRTNAFNQTDLVLQRRIGRLAHTLLAGAEIGRQTTDNYRQSGFFNGLDTSVRVALANPRVDAPVVFRQNATDADNRVTATVAALFAQDQVEVSRRVQVIGGLRLDRFDLQYHNNRNGETLSRVDYLVSPRTGVVFKPNEPVSVYGSYSVSFLPSSGDQFSSLTAVTRQLEPEKFTNYEVGLKWDVTPGLALTTAVYRLDRTNTRAIDPADPTRIVQTGSQRTDGYEVGVSGQIVRAWRIAGGYSYQDGFIRRQTAGAPAGARAGQVPRHTLSLWNQYQFHRRLAAGLGITHRSDMFVAFDNTVVLPGYTRVDAAAYFTVRKDLRVQANVENLLDRRFIVNAHSNNNLSPGAPRTLRLAMIVGF